VPLLGVGAERTDPLKTPYAPPCAPGTGFRVSAGGRVFGPSRVGKAAESPPLRRWLLPYDGAMPDYALLAAHLAAQPGPRITLSFAEVEAIIGGLLPLIARLHRAWWAEHGTGRRHHGGA
jgi:hypothetical protein